MTRGIKQFLIAFFTFIGGLYFFMEFVLPETINLPGIGSLKFGAYHEEISKGLQMIGVLAIGLGILNIARVHGSAVIRLRKGWLNSFALLAGLIGMLIVDGYEIAGSEQNLSLVLRAKSLAQFAERIRADYAASPTTDPMPRLAALDKALESFKTDVRSVHAVPLENPVDERNFSTVTELEPQIAETSRILTDRYREKAPADDAVIVEQSKKLTAQLTESQRSLQKYLNARHELTTPSKISHFMNEAFYASLGSAMFSLLAFYIATAAYRSFRLKSLEAFIMMSTALVVIFGQIPFGPLYISDALPQWRLRLLTMVNVPAFRAIYFGAAIAGVAMAIRMWLSLEPSPLAVVEAPSPQSAKESTRGKKQ